MSRTVSMPSSTANRIGQLIRLLSSPQPGEAGAAASALNRTLISAGLDVHELAKVVEQGLHQPRPTKQPELPRQQPPTPPKAHRPDSPLHVGDRLICDQPTGPFRACACGGILFTIVPGVGPHAAQLVCDGCQRGGRWVARQYFAPPPT
jgi:hypothetical protein